MSPYQLPVLRGRRFLTAYIPFSIRPTILVVLSNVTQPLISVLFLESSFADLCFRSELPFFHINSNIRSQLSQTQADGSPVSVVVSLDLVPVFRCQSIKIVIFATCPCSNSSPTLPISLVTRTLLPFSTILANFRIDC